jgi:acyl-CoA synthetase (NDP forming)
MRLTPLVSPHSIAIVGASQREDSLGSCVIRNLKKFGFEGEIVPVHPRFNEVEGLRCYPNLESVPFEVDAAFIAVPAAKGPTVLEAAGRRGVKAAFINASGYADAGAEGAELQRQLHEIALRYDLLICGPNNMGLINVHGRAAMWTQRHTPDIRPGPVAMISQSGSMALLVAQDVRGTGFSYIIATGNEAVLTAADYLAYVVADDRVQTILLFLETIRDPSAFARAAREAERRGKSIVVLKSGSSEAGQRAVAAHTGSLAGEDRFYDAFFRDLNIIRVHNPDELIETALLVNAYPWPPQPRTLTMITLSGGEAALIADNASALGLPLPPMNDTTAAAMRPAFPPFAKLLNPLEAWGLAFTAERFRMILATLVADPAIGAIGIATVTSAEGGPDAPWALEMARCCAEISGTHDKQIFFINSAAAGGPNRLVKTILDQAGIPFLSGMTTGLGAVARWLGRHDTVGSEYAPDTGEPATEWKKRFAQAAGTSDEIALLVAAQVPMVHTKQVRSPEEAAAAASALNAPIALKGCAPSLPHKTDLGLVHLGLSTPENVRAAYAKIDAALTSTLSPGAPREIVMQKMGRPGVEMIVGVRNDPLLGSFVVVGPGGIFVDVMGAASVRRGPIDVATANTMLDETVLGKLLAGVRGRPTGSRTAAAEAISAVSRIGALLQGSIATLEINPFIVTEHEALGVDVLVELAPSSTASA